MIGAASALRGPAARVAGLILALLTTPVSVAAQTWRAIPAQFQELPANAGLAMPARWTQGKLQTIYDGPAVPLAFTGATLNGVRARRAVFVGDGAWPSTTIRMRVALASGQNVPDVTGIRTNCDVNRVAAGGLTTVVDAMPVSIPATARPSAGARVGEDMVVLPFAQPFPFTGPRLMVEWANLETVFTVADDQWIDSVSLGTQGDAGMAVTVGNGGCGSSALTPPMQLVYAGTYGPGFGRTNRLTLTAGLPGAVAAVAVGFDPEVRQPGFDLGFGASLSVIGLTGCHLWSGADLLLPHTIGTFGDLPVSLVLPALPVWEGSSVGVQVWCVDPAANPLGLAVSNGVVLRMNRVGCGTGMATVLVPGPGDQSPYGVFFGMAPVLLFDVR